METNNQKHLGPPLAMQAIIFTALFITGLVFVVSFSPVHYPGPWESAETIVNYFRNQSHNVLMCSFFQLGAAIPLGLYAVNAVSRFRFLGVKSAGPYIALFGGIMVAVNTALAASIGWVMSVPGIAEDPSVIRALYYVAFAIGGVGYSVPLGLFFAGVAISAGFAKLLPKWLVIMGIILAVFGELSWFSMLEPKMIYLIPLTRFPGFIWLIIVGFKLPKTIPLAR